MMKHFYWALLWLPLFIVGIIFRILSPIACLFIYQSSFSGYVKRLDKTTVMIRDRLVWTWFDTFDNPTDEYWYGCYGDTVDKRQTDYNKNPVLRWWYRVLWLQRNSAYTFNYKFFGIAKDSALAWHYENYSPITSKLRWNINIGWKAHKGFNKLMFAGRVIGIKKVSRNTFNN